MKEIIPNDGAPTYGESLNFMPEDAALAVGAVSYYVSSDLRTLEANWDSEGYNGMTADVDTALENLDQIVTFVEHGKELASKLAAHHEDPSQPAVLTDEDIEMLGAALFRFGNSGILYADRAVKREAVTEESRDRQLDELGLRAIRSQAIFKWLEPIAQSKGIPWMRWL